MGEILALVFISVLFIAFFIWTFFQIGPGVVYRKVDRKKAPLFAVTFHCPVCGEVMKFEHESCEAKHDFLKSHTKRLTEDIKDMKAGKTW